MVKLIRQQGDFETEFWRPIPSCPGYLASSWGRIMGPQRRPIGRSNRYGYQQVAIQRDGKTLTRMVGRLVCEAFHGPAPSPGHEAAHWDGIRTNNRPKNLRWATSWENHQDRKRHGTWPGLEQHPGAQLTLAQVREIKAVYTARQPGRYIKRGMREALAAKFGVKISLIKDIVAGRCWIDV